MFDDILIDLVTTAVQLHGDPSNGDKRFRKGEDKEGLKLPYIIHPLQVLYRIQRWGITERTNENFDFWKAVLFHDILEDTSLVAEDLMATLGERAVKIVLELTKDEATSKDEYMKGFATKSIEALVGKIADRLCNVEDFVWQNPKYAKKYMVKARPLFETMYLRQQEIRDRFGEKVWNLSRADYLHVVDQLSSIFVG